MIKLAQINSDMLDRDGLIRGEQRPSCHDQPLSTARAIETIQIERILIMSRTALAHHDHVLHPSRRPSGWYLDNDVRSFSVSFPRFHRHRLMMPALLAGTSAPIALVSTAARQFGRSVIVEMKRMTNFALTLAFDLVGVLRQSSSSTSPMTTLAPSLTKSGLRHALVLERHQKSSKLAFEPISGGSLVRSLFKWGRSIRSS